LTILVIVRSVRSWRQGTELWNGTTLLRKREGANLERPLGQRTLIDKNCLILVRYMACLMIEIGGTDDKHSRFRVFQAFLKTAHFCIGISSLNWFKSRNKGTWTRRPSYQTMRWRITPLLLFTSSFKVTMPWPNFPSRRMMSLCKVSLSPSTTPVEFVWYSPRLPY